MKRPLILVLVGIVGGFAVSSTVAQTFSEIIPMRSTCSEVTKLLGVEGCKRNLEVYYLKNLSVEISYSSEVCETAYEKKWNVQPWTVLSATFYFRQEIVLNDFAKTLDIDLNTCSKSVSTEEGIISNDLTMSIYRCKEKGVSFWSSNGFLSTMILKPSSKEDELICKPRTKKIKTSKASVRRKP